jgi:hypothetical protein
MNFEKVSLTLYDVFGYIVPGYVMLLVASLVESTFGNTTFLSIASATGNVLLSIIAAYFLGNICHSLGSLFREWHPAWFADRGLRLSDPLFHKVRKAAKEAYGIELKQDEKLSTLETFILADSYVVASGGSTERDVYLAREGFFKASMVAFGLLSAVLFAACLNGGIDIQTDIRTVKHVNLGSSIAVTAMSLLATLILWKQFTFYQRVKMNNIFAMFLAFYQKDVQKSKEE